MTKEELKNGAVVELRNGKRYLKVEDNILLNLKMNGDYMLLNDYCDDLTHIEDNYWDIVKVNNTFDNELPFAILALKDVYYNDEWTWERQFELIKEARQFLDKSFYVYKGKEND